MKHVVHLGLAVGAAGLVLIGCNAVPGGTPESTASAGTPSSTSSAAASADFGPATTQIPSASETSTAPSSAQALGLVDGDLRPGVYTASTIPPARIVLTVPDGWRTVQDLKGFSGIVKGTLGDQPQTSDFRAIAFWTIGTVFVDPCARTPRTPPVGTTVEDLAQAFSEIPSTKSTIPVQTTVGGYPAANLQLTLDLTLPCHPSGFTLWPGRYAQGPGERDDLWIVDVEGTRLVVLAEWLPGVTDGDLAEIREIVDSIAIMPAGG